MRQLHVLRIVAGFLVGLGGHIFFQTLVDRSVFSRMLQPNTDDICSSCEDRNKVRGEPCPFCGPERVLMEADPNIAEAYKPKGMYEITRWYYFDEEHLYDIINGEPKVKLVGGWYEETKAVTQVALEYINVNTMLGKTWNLVRLQNGYLRTDVFRGTDYILDLGVKSVETHESECVDMTFRVRMVHAFEKKGTDLKVLSQRDEPDVGIHIIVAVSGNEDALENFVALYAEMRSHKDKLTLVLFKGKAQFGDESITLQPKLEQLIKDFPNSAMTYIEVEGDYSFLQAMGQALSKQDEIILTLTLDMHFGQDLLQTCRLISLPGKRAYFPIAFSQYDPDIIERGMPPGKPKNINKMDINKFTGYWMLKTHDFICAYARDLTPVLEKVLFTIESSPETTSFNDEGGTNIYNAFLSNDIDIISAVEPDLTRIFRHRRCDRRFMSDSEYDHCFKTVAEMLGSKPTLSILYLTEVALKKV